MPTDHPGRIGKLLEVCHNSAKNADFGKLALRRIRTSGSAGREGGRLRIRAPSGALIVELRALVVEHRAALLASVPRVRTGGEPSGLTAAEIAEFRRLGVEVWMRSSSAGEFWLVPAYSGDTIGW